MKIGVSVFPRRPDGEVVPVDPEAGGAFEVQYDPTDPSSVADARAALARHFGRETGPVLSGGTPPPRFWRRRARAGGTARPRGWRP